MSLMRGVHLRTLDLNLVHALQALLEERHVTRAAKRSFLSQPAMSRALERLLQRKIGKPINNMKARPIERRPTD